MSTGEKILLGSTLQTIEKQILQSQKIQRFITSKQSETTRTQYITWITDYFETIKQNPDIYFRDNYEFLPSKTKQIVAKQYRKDLEDYKIKLLNERNKKGTDNKPSTIRTWLSCIRSLFTYNEIELPTAFWKQLNNFKNIRSGDKETPSAEQVAQILQHLDLQGKAIFILMATTGSRITSILKLRRKDIDLASLYPTVIFRGGNVKNKTPKRKKTTSEVKRILEEYLKQHNYQPEDYLFPGKPSVIQPDGKKRMIANYTTHMSKSNAEYKWKYALTNAGLFNKNEDTLQATMTPQSLKRFFRTQSSKLNESLSKHFSEHGGLDSRYKDLSDKDLTEEYAKIAPNLHIYERPVDTDVKIIELQKQLKNTEDKLSEAKRWVKENRDQKEKYSETAERLEQRMNQIEQNIKDSFNPKGTEYNLAYKLAETVINNDKDLKPQQKDNLLSQRDTVDQFFKIWTEQTTKNKTTLLDAATELMENPDKIDEILATIPQKTINKNTQMNGKPKKK
jgi:integrase